MSQTDTPSPETLRQVLGAFATGVAVITTGRAGQNACAMTVNSFTSVSLDPPLVLFCVDRAAFHLNRFLDADDFAVNILTGAQQDLSNRFAQEAVDGFDDLDTTRLTTGCPVFADALAVLDCEVETRHDAGDHVIVLGRVVALRTPSTEDPLLFYRGAYAGIRR